MAVPKRSAIMSGAAVTPDYAPAKRRSLPTRVSQKQAESLFAAFGAWGYDNRGWLPSTRARYLQDVRRLANSLEKEGTSIWRATNRDLRGFLFALPPNPRYRNRMRQAFLAFFDFLMEEGYREDNPATGLPRLSEPRLVPKPITETEAKRLIRIAKQHGPQVHALIATFLYVGLRRTEIRTLRWAQIDDEGWVRFTAKGGQERVLPIHPVAQRALKEWRYVSADPEWVFPGRRENTPVSGTWVRVKVHDLGVEAGIVGLHPHRLRHTFATSLMEKTNDLRLVQEAMGHADPKTTAIYTRVRPVRIKDAIDTLEF